MNRMEKGKLGTYYFLTDWVMDSKKKIGLVVSY